MIKSWLLGNREYISWNCRTQRTQHNRIHTMRNLYLHIRTHRETVNFESMRISFSSYIYIHLFSIRGIAKRIQSPATKTNFRMNHILLFDKQNKILLCAKNPLTSASIPTDKHTYDTNTHRYLLYTLLVYVNIVIRSRFVCVMIFVHSMRSFPPHRHTATATHIPAKFFTSRSSTQHHAGCRLPTSHRVCIKCLVKWDRNHCNRCCDSAKWADQIWWRVFSDHTTLYSSNFTVLFSRLAGVYTLFRLCQKFHRPNRCRLKSRIYRLCF